ncbi:MAG TPA: ABC transporter permease subunit [Candidatus Limnocylindria bacterium]|jgi:sodium transport system permease protein|nr:ABC transporter permease subunit [Candidatus Limnocylindria bacterium]
MRVTWIVYRKELQEILRDRRTLLAIGLAALATPLVLFVISQVSTKTATQTYTVGYSGDIPTGLDILLRAASLRFVPVPDPAAAAKSEVDLGVAFLPGEIDEYYDPSRQGAQIADVRLQTVLGQYQAAQAAAALQSRGIDPGILTPLKFVSHPLSSPVQAASNAFLSFFLPYILITMILTGGFSAALDSSAGERERRTLEGLLLTPAARSNVLLGKIAAITTISLVAAVAAIGSMFVALSQIETPGAGPSANHITLSPAVVPVMVWLALLIAVSFSAVTLALGTLAKSFRQGQAYVTPLYFITILPASLVLFVPDFNPSLAYYLIPILNAVLVLRDAIVHDSVGWAPLLVTTASLLATGALSWFAALRLFTREALLTRS